MSEEKKLNTKERMQKMQEQIQQLHTANVALASSQENMRISVIYLQDKFDALVSLLEEGNEVNIKKAVDDRVVENNINVLKREVQDAVEKGALTSTEVAGPRSFVVAKETNKDTGEIEQPRVQIALTAMPEEIQQDFLGKVVGDVIEKEENIIEIQEIYDIKDLSQE